MSGPSAAERAREIVDWAGGPPTHLDPESSWEFALAAKIRDALTAHAAEARRVAREACARKAQTHYRRERDGEYDDFDPERQRREVAREIAKAIRALAAPAREED